ncbi:MAG: streptomycin biosynthesis protein StrI [Isosphaeraceae bacterium]|jgi:predicted dehydrogenase|nr:MAG: streptomycin biosynthesis protein StrI [Isosphaeraceae bacterium]
MRNPRPASSRRSFLQSSTTAVAASAFAGLSTPLVHAGEDNTIQLALIGCGGRGTGAAGNALSTQNGPVKLVAMADVFPDRLAASYDTISKEFSDKIDVPEDRRFIGFDAYQKAIDCLKPGDVAIMATPPAFRWVHFQYAIEKGVHVFMEKPVTVDGPTSKKMFALGEKAAEKNLKVGIGLMCRHCTARDELYRRIQDGQLGEIILMRAYRMHGPIGFFEAPPKPDDISELMYQVQRFHAFLWASGGAYSDFYIHNIDECCWMKNAWPIEARALGGRHYRGDSLDQNFDSYSVEYTFADGSKLYLEGRCIDGCEKKFASFAHGTKRSAIISTSGHTPARCRIYNGQHIGKKSELAWAFPQPEPNPYQLEWDHLIDAIRNDRPYNEVKRGVEASLVTSMGRMAAHTGQVVTYDDILNCDHEFAPTVAELTFDSPAPLLLGDNGKYPVPEPGIKIDREY